MIQNIIKLLGRGVGVLNGASKVAMGLNPAFPGQERIYNFIKSFLPTGGGGVNTGQAQSDLAPKVALMDQMQRGSQTQPQTPQPPKKS